MWLCLGGMYGAFKTCTTSPFVTCDPNQTSLAGDTTPQKRHLQFQVVSVGHGSGHHELLKHCQSASSEHAKVLQDLVMLGGAKEWGMFDMTTLQGFNGYHMVPHMLDGAAAVSACN